MTNKQIVEELNWLKARLHSHSHNDVVVNLEYVDARIDDIISVNKLKKVCRCACHNNKLNKPYAHDTQCCDKMNGYIDPGDQLGTFST